jgi:hypothetical protein
MSPNNSENAMARFLFAILKQKNLKDIDWNLVAQDPVLLQPVPNGHAARMRYSRFRSTILNQEPQKRNRIDDSCRITKSTKKGGSSAKSKVIKSESSTGHSSYAQLSPASLPSPYLPDFRDDFGPRFPTPCSDDMTAGLCIDPASIGSGRNSEANLFTANLYGDFLGQQQTHPHTNYDQAGLDMGHSPALTAFELALDMTSPINDTPGFGEQQPSLGDIPHEWNNSHMLPRRRAQ